MNASAHRFRLAALGLIVLMSSCERNIPEVPGTLSNWPEMSYPQDNQPDASKINLGRQLFEDPILSVDSSISCASCHKAQFALADNLTVSPGVEGRLGVRNSPSLLNIGYQPYFMREGGVPTLEMQILVPIQEHNEMAFNMVLLANRLNQDSTYKKLFLQAFNDSATAYTITRSIAQYERTLIYKDADIDAYISGDNNAITPSAKRGMELFYGAANCSKCHSGPLFTDYSFHNNGTSMLDGDYGRGQLTLDSSDFYTFKVPSLRNAALTAPFMHDGSVATLEDVLLQYNAGGTLHDYQSLLIQPLGLSTSQLSDLQSFMEAL